MSGLRAGSGARIDRLGFERSEIAGRTRQILNRGSWGNADVLLIDGPEGPVVVKDFAPRRWLVRRIIGPWLLNRERLAYRRLGGMRAVPRLLGRLDAQALVFAFRPGILLSRSLRGRVPEDFLEELSEVIAEMHRRGVVHLDLRHRSNILADEEGHPVLLDFASSLRFDPDSRSGRFLLGSLGWLDRRALEKWRVRLAEEPGTTAAVGPSPVPGPRRPPPAPEAPRDPAARVGRRSDGSTRG